MTALVVAALAAVVSAVLVEAVKRKGILDHPNERSLHEIATPRGGGVGIVAVAVLGWIFATSVTPQPLWVRLGWPVGALAIAAVSIVDDIRSVSRRTRFLVHVAAAALAVTAYGPWRILDLGAFEVPLGALSVPLTLVWIVAVTNIYNFMDGSDGIAGTQALVAGGGWAVAAAAHGLPSLAILGAAIAGGSAGFLKHNWAPASIFMGDVGSTVLGFTFAVMPLMARPADPALATAGVLFLWPFLLDGTVTILLRAARGENILQAHRQHVYQRLVRSGWKHSSVALLYGALALLGAVVAWWVL